MPAILRRGVPLAIVLACGVAASCTSSTTASRPDPDAVKLATTEPTVLDNKGADSITEFDVINRSKSHVKRTGEIYMMRGLANVFSRGIDDMAVELRGRGYDAVNFSYTRWQPIADDIVRRSRSKSISYPVVIVGHSLGGNESSKFANYLAANNVKVALVVAFDPVETGYVGKGIGKVVNYYLPKQKTDNRIHAKDGFSGNISNVDVTVNSAITHTNVDKDPEYQAATYASIANITGKRRQKTVRNTAPGF